MYSEAQESGLLAAIPGKLWKMLCCLATYMDETLNVPVCRTDSEVSPSHIIVKNRPVSRFRQGSF